MMAILYLRAGAVENVTARRKARMLGVLHEMYVQDIQNKGASYENTYVTRYHVALQRELQEVGGEAVEGDEYLIEVDTEGAFYSVLPDIHKTRLKTKAEVEALGIDVDLTFGYRTL